MPGARHRTSRAMPAISGRCRKPSVARPQAVIDRCWGVKSLKSRLNIVQYSILYISIVEYNTVKYSIA